MTTGTKRAPGARNSELSPKETYNAVLACCRANVTPLLLGAPGVGKTHIVREVGRELGLPVKEILLAQREPTDFIGIPTVDILPDGQKRSAFAPPKDFVTDKPMLLFLDEFLQAPLETQRAASEIILEHRVGGIPLHPDTRVVCASNRKEDRAGTAELLGHNKSRLCTMHVTTTTTDWLDWARSSGVNAMVVQYIEQNDMAALYPPRKDHKDDSYACPRTWEKVSTVLNSFHGGDFKGIGGRGVLTPLIIGLIGEGNATQFIQWMARAADRPSIDEIHQNPTGCRIPSGQEDQQQFALSILSAYDKIVAGGLRQSIVTYLTRMHFDTLVGAHKQLSKKAQTMPEMIEDLRKIKAALEAAGEISA